jgi:hypothetical protein
MAVPMPEKYERNLEIYKAHCFEGMSYAALGREHRITPARVREIVSKMALICRDCGVDTIAIGEYYMVRDALWDEAWRGYYRKLRHERRMGDEILCLVCLCQRLGRPLHVTDFTAQVPRSLDRWHEWGSDGG